MLSDPKPRPASHTGSSTERRSRVGGRSFKHEFRRRSDARAFEVVETETFAGGSAELRLVPPLTRKRQLRLKTDPLLCRYFFTTPISPIFVHTISALLLPTSRWCPAYSMHD